MKNLLTRLVFLLFCAAICTQCNQNETAETPPTVFPEGSDPHSFSQPLSAAAEHLDLHLKVNFDKKTLAGFAKWRIKNHGAGEIIFDTKDLDIQKVTLGADTSAAPFFLVAADPLLGSALRIPIDSAEKTVTIHYATRPTAAALGWMDAAQTAGKKRPFLFTQGQAILTRTWIPCQDSPGNRVTYSATIEAPAGTMAVMSAENPQATSPDGIYQFKMEQPIPPYLIALAVGEIGFKQVGKRTGVYAEPALLQKVAWEFDDMEKMVEAAEELYGPYDWGRFDLIVLPPGFPFGGMENPRLTFATPTVVTGDRSLVSLVAHELAHSWSGNLVTNATWDDFWLNEGFTVYFERRIMEKRYGKEYVGMLAQLEYWELLAEIKDLDAAGQAADTQLKLHLAGRDPDEAGTAIAYQKGSLFLQHIEEKAGSERFDAFLRQYFAEHKFQSMTTERFLNYLKTNLLTKYSLDVNVDEWVYQPDLPASCPKVGFAKLEAVQQNARAVVDGWQGAKKWTPHEWVYFLREPAAGFSVEDLKKVDQHFKLTQSKNSEVLFVWFEMAIRRGFSADMMPEIETFLTGMGRRRFLLPLYRAFVETGQADAAKSIYQKAKAGYHSVSSGSVEELLKTQTQGSNSNSK